MTSVAVCVPAHARPERLRALLDALAAQDRPADEVVVCCDDDASFAAASAHPLAPATLRLPPGQPPGAQRNAAWRAARADVVAFTDDDCRPAPGWLAALTRGDGGIAQGTTAPDPAEAHLLRERLARSVAVTPPDLRGQTCNIAYPRALLERLGGFSGARGGEDADLLHRALAAGAQLRAVPEAVVWHAVEVRSLRDTLAAARRWEDLPAAVRRNPSLRRTLVARTFWSPAHAALVVGALLVPRLGLAALLPWVAVGQRRYGPSWRGRARALGDLPLRLLVEGAEVAAIARGALRERVLVL